MDIADFHGLMTINSKDIYADYRVWLFDKKGEQSNLDAIMMPAPVKTNSGVNIREETGRKYSDNLLPVMDERDFTLYFACHGDNNTDFLINYTSFLNFLRSGLDSTGWLTIQLSNVPGYSFRCFLKKPELYEAITYMDELDVVVSLFKVTFTEPTPNF
ncbi:MAG: hypothetical protein WCS17_05235 [Prevotella sp.]